MVRNGLAHLCAWGLSFLLMPMAQAQVGYSMPPSQVPVHEVAVCTDAQLKQHIPCPDYMLFFLEGKAKVQGLLSTARYAELDTLYNQWCTGKDRFPDGRWKLSMYADGIMAEITAWKSWKQSFERVAEWRSQFPNSEAALFIEAVLWRMHAWDARGAGYSSSVSRDARDLFKERLAKALAIANQLPVAGSKCPAPYVLKINLAVDTGAPLKQVEAIYNEGFAKYPEFHSIPFYMARAYSPLWGGSAEAYEKFAISVAEKTKSFEGDGMYARLYWLADRRNELPFMGEDQPIPNWSRLRKGYEDLMRLYPSSVHNIGKFAGVACRSRDSVLYRKLRSSIDGFQDDVEMFEPADVCDRRHKWKKGANR